MHAQSDTLKLHIIKHLKTTLPVIATALAGVDEGSVCPDIRL